MKYRGLVFGGLMMVVGSVVGAVVAVALVGGGRAQAQDSTITAGSFYLFDGSGNGRASLATDSQGAVWLNLRAVSNEGGVAIGVAADGRPVVRLLDGSGRDRADISLDELGMPGMHVRDSNGNSRAGIWWDEANAEAVISLGDANGWRRVSLTSKGEVGGLNVYDSVTKRVYVGMLGNGYPTVSVGDRGGNARVQTTVLSDGTGAMGFFNAAGVLLDVLPKGSALLGPLR